MATRKTAKKTTKKATINFKWDTGTKTTKKASKKVEKHIKKAGLSVVICLVLLLIVGAVGGVFGIKYVIRNDCFELIGNDELTLQLGQSYKDEGVKVVAFGKDDSSKIKIETNLTKNEDGTYSADELGTYYIVYKVDNLKYGSIVKVQKIRLITFVEVSEGSEYEG